jgi:hypothetical protein
VHFIGSMVSFVLPHRHLFVELDQHPLFEGLPTHTSHDYKL